MDVGLGMRLPLELLALTCHGNETVPGGMHYKMIHVLLQGLEWRLWPTCFVLAHAIIIIFYLVVVVGIAIGIMQINCRFFGRLT